MIDYGETNKFEKLPRVGEPPKIFEIVNCEKVINPTYKYNITERIKIKQEDGSILEGEKNLGFHYKFNLKNGRYFTINSKAPLAAFGKANVQDGHTIKVSHPEKSIWQVEILK